MKINWSKSGFWIGLSAIIFGAFITYYFSVLYSKNPNLNVIVYSNTEILDIKEDLPKLDILYDNASIKKQSKNISIIIFRLVNSGDESILVSYYDDNSPFGIKINNGNILSTPELINSSDTSYYKTVIDTIIENCMQFKKLIFDSKSYIEIKCLVIHDIHQKPSLVSTGKIAKIKKIEIDNKFLENTKETITLLKYNLFRKYLIVFSIITIIFLLVNIIQLQKSLKKKTSKDGLIIINKINMKNKKIKDDIYEICKLYEKESIDIEIIDKKEIALVYRTTQMDSGNIESSFQSDLKGIEDKYKIEIMMVDISK